MKLIPCTVGYIQQEPGIEGMFKMIAESAYICYQTEVARLPPEQFVKTILIPNKHNRALEFGTVYLELPYWQSYDITGIVSFFKYNNWSRTRFVGESNNPRWAITTNYRVIVENSLEDQLDMYMCEPTEYHAKRYCAEFILSRGAGDDFRTHIGLSSIMESSRWCNYSKDKFGNELTFVKPYWVDDSKNTTEISDFTLETFKRQEEMYLQGAKLGMQAQQLKRILPLGIKTTLRMCGFKDAWDNFFFRRCDSHADPECQFLANELQKQLYDKL